MAKRSNPFAGDGKASGITAGMRGHPSNTSVRVTAHTRRKPVRDWRAAPKVMGVRQGSDQEPDNAFAGSAAQFDTPQGPEAVMGLQRPGEKPANHLKGAISLLNRSRV